MTEPTTDADALRDSRRGENEPGTVPDALRDPPRGGSEPGTVSLRRRRMVVGAVLLAPVVATVAAFAGDAVLSARAAATLQSNVEGRLGVVMEAKKVTSSERSRLDDLIEDHDDDDRPTRTVDLRDVTLRAADMPTATLHAGRIQMRQWYQSRLTVEVQDLRIDVTGSADALGPRVRQLLDAAQRRGGPDLYLDLTQLKIVVHDPLAPGSSATYEGDQSLQLEANAAIHPRGDLHVTLSSGHSR